MEGLFSNLREVTSASVEALDLVGNFRKGILIKYGQESRRVKNAVFH